MSTLQVSVLVWYSEELTFLFKDFLHIDAGVSFLQFSIGLVQNCTHRKFLKVDPRSHPIRSMWEHSNFFSMGRLVCSHYYLHKNHCLWIVRIETNCACVSVLTQAFGTLCVWVRWAGHTTAGVGRGLWSGTRGFLQRRSRRRTVLHTLLKHTQTDSVHIFFPKDSNRPAILTEQN